jgi:hypothetical protein
MRCEQPTILRGRVLVDDWLVAQSTDLRVLEIREMDLLIGNIKMTYVGLGIVQFRDFRPKV